MPPAWNANATVVALQTGMVADVRGRLFLLLGVVVMILVIACANVANLSLARAGARSKEIGIRSALGAGQSRIAQQLLTESVVIAGAGGLLGLLVATQGLSLLARVLPADTPGLANAHLDWRVLAFTAVIALGTGIVFGLAPASQAARLDVSDSLSEGGRGAATAVSPRLRGVLVVAEVAASVLVVIAAALLVRSLWTLSAVETGFRVDRVMSARITPGRPLCAEPERCLAFYSTMVDRVGASPGVGGVALINTLPLTGDVAKRSVVLEGFQENGGRRPEPLFWLNVVTPDYFRVMNVRIFAGGRSPTPISRGTRPSRSFRDRRRANTGATRARRWARESGSSAKRTWHTVVGIADDVRAYNLQRDEPGWIAGTMYVPFSPRATLENRSDCPST